MGTADRLLDLMYEWMERAEECSSNLRALAEELESLREKCNAVETVSSTVAAATTVMSFIAAPFTGGTSLLVGAVFGGVGAGVSAITKLIEAFESSDKLKRLENIDTCCLIIVSKIEDLYWALRNKCPSECPDDKDQYVVKEFLKAMLRRSKLDVRLDINDLDKFVKDAMNDLLIKNFPGSPLLKLLLTEVVGVLTVFSLKLGGSVIPTIAIAGGVQIGKTVICAGGSAVLLGLVGLGINLYESIKNWKELVKKKHETDASKSLRDTARKVDKAKTELFDKLSKIKKMLTEVVEKLCTKRRPLLDASSDEEEERISDTDSSSESFTLPQTRKKLQKIVYIEDFETSWGSPTSLQSLNFSEEEDDNPFMLYNMSQTKQSVRAKTNSKGSKSGKNPCNIPWLFLGGQMNDRGAAAAYGPPDPPRDHDKDRSSESCNESESTSQSESSSESESDSEFESSSEVEEVLKMALQNFRSLNKIVHGRKFSPNTLRDLLQRNSLDVLLITETWIKKENLPADVVRRLLPENYSIFLVPRPLDHGKSGGGGVAIVHRNDVACEPMSFRRTTTFEYVATAITTSRSIEPLLVLNIYRPPEGTVAEFVESFLSEFESLLSEAYDRFTHVVIGGDFNIWVDSLKTKAQKFKETRVGNELIQHVSQSTHNRGRILDLILARSNVTITIVSVDDNDFSDHSTVIFIAKLRLKKNKSKRFKKREYDMF